MYATSRNGIAAQFDKGAAKDLALTLLDQMEQRAVAHGDVLSLGDLAEMAGLGPTDPAILPAINILSASDFAVLETGGEFVDDDGECHLLSAAAFQQVIHQDVLIHPVTQQRLDHASGRVQLAFKVTLTH